MVMDKSWTKITNKVDPKFMKGAIAFAEMAKCYVDSEGRTHCPCKSCLNVRKHAPESYKIWTFHEESRQANEINNEHDESDNEPYDGVDDLLGDAFHVEAEPEGVDDNDEVESYNRSSNPNVDKLFADMEKPLFQGCDTFSILGFILRLMHVKGTCKMTNVSMDMILKLLSEAFKDTIISKTYYEEKKYLRTIGVGYDSKDACKNDCALFWKENLELQSCPVCGTSRWIPTKFLRYIHIISRLKRLYASRYTAKDMQWHAHNKSKEDGVLRDTYTKIFIGDSAISFATEVGIVMWSFCQMEFHTWEKVAKENKEEMVNRLRENFELPHEDKKNGGTTDPQLARSKMKPNCHSEEDWGYLCDYWKSDKAKQYDEQMKHNRGKVVIPSRGGSRSIENHKFAMKIKRLRCLPTQSNYIISSIFIL
uniref:Transposase-associated domain-containing protein n=1 Tax=Lactuca sativa TaxID=4236 RepID=A0A9R1UPS3_LACSA|nr:hypothetical protein LSAT_V11C800424070 [Lactuca sativa]